MASALTVHWSVVSCALSWNENNVDHSAATNTFTQIVDREDLFVTVSSLPDPTSCFPDGPYLYDVGLEVHPIIQGWASTDCAPKLPASCGERVLFRGLRNVEDFSLRPIFLEMEGRIIGKVFRQIFATCFPHVGKLSDLTEIPPYRETGVAIPLSLCFLWYRRLSLLHPHFFP